MRKTTLLLLAPALAAASPAWAKTDPFRAAMDSCWSAAQGRMGGYAVRNGDPRLHQRNDSESIVEGDAQANGRYVHYQCIYNFRSRSLVDVSVSGDRNGHRNQGYGRNDPYNRGYGNQGYYPAPGYDQGYNPGYGNNYGYANVPRWAVGAFDGVNRRTGARVGLEIAPDGQANAWIDGRVYRGRVTDDILSVGPWQFRLSRDGNGLKTRQLNDRDNVVHYRRTR